MNKELLLTDLSELLEIDQEKLVDNFDLSKNELWDSLAIVSTIASIDQHYNASVHGCELESCRYVSDLFKTLDRVGQKKNNVFCIAGEK